MRSCALVSFVIFAFLVRPAFAQGFTDPVQYCQAAGTIDHPDSPYSGPKSPAWIAAALKVSPGLPFTWRCANGAVLACAFGANIPCDAKANVAQVPNTAIRDYCRKSPDADFVPMAVTGHDAAATWRCQGNDPVVVSVAKVDAQGYEAAYWTNVTP
jgi:hypothetical protein